MPADDKPGRFSTTPPEDPIGAGRVAREQLGLSAQGQHGDLAEEAGPTAAGQQGMPEDATGSFADKLTVDPTRGDTKG
jgi:hypothetical protein